MSNYYKEEELVALARELGMDEPGAEDGPRTLDMKWEPRLNPVQRKLYLAKSPFLLAHGERGTGKSVSALHKLVRYCVRNRNGLGFIIVREVGQADQGGAWYKLITEILPQWKHGNFDRKTKKLIDKGCGIEYTTTKLHSKTKAEYIWVSNRYGGWSMIMMISLFVDEHVKDKIKGREFGFALVDEAQTTESDAYFSGIVQQMGRRQDADDDSQIVYCANPKGPSHWLWKRFLAVKVGDGEEEYEECPIDENYHPLHPQTLKPRLEYQVFHIPISENRENLRKGYWEIVIEACANDEIEYARMIEGRWIDKPEGEAIFSEWSDAQCLLGDAAKRIGILPVKGHVIDIGWDPGAAHSSLHLMQHVAETDLTKIYWIVFDELNFVGRYMPYKELVAKLIRRLQYWEELVGYEFVYRHISDDSAFNQFRPGSQSGSYDAADIERFSKEFVKENNLPERFIIRMLPCPKGPYSVEARVRMQKDIIISGRFKVSATCRGTREMFMQLPHDPKNRMNPLRCKYIHPFDSLTYPPFFYQHGIGRIQIIPEHRPPPEFYVAGKG